MDCALYLSANSRTLKQLPERWWGQEAPCLLTYLFLMGEKVERSQITNGGPGTDSLAQCCVGLLNTEGFCKGLLSCGYCEEPWLHPYFLPSALGAPLNHVGEDAPETVGFQCLVSVP